ncbi:hypothetical protein A3F00_03335 [Candidatus Daviesbacteria bacterium RIFCSPHIGHO2_12_FULL_37_11]|uniref:Uncharacterized protein n=1 Tax=Candidatus Daviesbacteria bacterium RIFCSPHIGHO2_12_FULL_37_11 TaxID=1797777 RepID=A0A1F5KD18_9BACT|nr:MAG: hypothetical protein A2769_01570 [Candidatus Daviesbacteria bacterium RIFCSPHIGHO2_01_FULL_37_27]OGE38754.1 MAG: hypothetical protein A3F00_03335 [Candidatus Daviesbacteria bacterium RIFCSPHIGHO2_12_FULL_37_11]OGE44917.1 MAG: hypothetical protein A3B39_02365 [Candidatus Daviesbacteria bacterium RIFCSPLOWO2_01_FULL_37_10]
MITEKALTSEYAAQLLYHSFRFSQGDFRMQRSLFSYIHELHPFWRIYSEQEEIIKNMLIKPFSMHTAGFRHIRVGIADLNRQLSGELKYFVDTLNENPNQDQYIYPYENAAMAREFILRDYKFLCDIWGRTRLHPNPEVFTEDPFASFFRYYILEEQTTGLEEFDQMFSDIRAFFITSVGLDDWEIKKDNSIMPAPKYYDKVKPGSALFWVAQVWEEQHPGKQYFAEFSLPDYSLI